MKSRLLLFALFISFAIHAQTNVSGGIYTNTTWTVANSPYIVVDTVVVFPNVTLTIDPGVTVKFDVSKRIEIRQGQLIANGTTIDSIYFTSNSPSAIAGDYGGIFLNNSLMKSEFNYCSFSYADVAIKSTIDDSLIVNNSTFYLNRTGINFDGAGTMPGSGQAGMVYIDKCVFSNHSVTGIDFENVLDAVITNSAFTQNNSGLISIYIHGKIKNCVFDNNQSGLNTEYMHIDSCTMVHNQTGFNSGSINVLRNCRIDSNSVTGMTAIGDSVSNCLIRFNGDGIITKSSIITGNVIEDNFNNGIGDLATWNGTGSDILGNAIRRNLIAINDSMSVFEITNNMIEDNHTGIIIRNANSAIHCNKICNNSTYGLSNLTALPVDAINNYWCVSDSIGISSGIFDGYDNINYGLVSYMPYDSMCYIVTGVSEHEKQQELLVYPNPVRTGNTVRVKLPFANGIVKVFNSLGKEVMMIKCNNENEVRLNINDMPAGLYLIQLAGENGNIPRMKLVVD
jgi:hypothetical protein